MSELEHPTKPIRMRRLERFYFLPVGHHQTFHQLKEPGRGQYPLDYQPHHA